MLRAGMSLARINLTWCGEGAGAGAGAGAGEGGQPCERRAQQARAWRAPQIAARLHGTQRRPHFPPFSTAATARGPLDFHLRTLKNLQDATRLEQRLCGVIVGTSGREIPVVGRPTAQLPCGWWQHTDALAFEAGQRVVVTAREGAAASSGVLPIAFKDFAGAGGGRGQHAWLRRTLLALRRASCGGLVQMGSPPLRACPRRPPTPLPGLVSPGDVLYVGRYLTVGSGSGALTPHPSALLVLRVLGVSGADVECKALGDATLEGLLTISHPGGQQQQRAAASAADAAAAGAAGLQLGAVEPPAAGGGGAGAWGAGADGSANYSLPILSANDLAALEVRRWRLVGQLPGRCSPAPAAGPACCAACSPPLSRPPLAHPLPPAPAPDHAPPQSLAAAFPDMIDFVAVSYVRCASEIAGARAALEGIGLGSAGVAAEINTAAALGR
jgi:hypothetical protein